MGSGTSLVLLSTLSHETCGYDANVSSRKPGCFHPSCLFLIVFYSHCSPGRKQSYCFSLQQMLSFCHNLSAAKAILLSADFTGGGVCGVCARVRVGVGGWVKSYWDRRRGLMLLELLFITGKVIAIFKIHETAASVDVWPDGSACVCAATQNQLWLRFH